MAKPQQTRQAAQGAWGWASGGRLALPPGAGSRRLVTGMVLLLLMAGCNGLDRQVGPASGAGAVDPLVGGPPLPGTRPPAAQSTAQTPALMPNTTLPPLPAPNSGLSNAALASETPSRPLDPDHDLRIRDGQAQPGNDGWGGAGTQPAARGGGAVLGRPELPTEPATHDDRGLPGAGGAPGLTYEQIQRRLTDLGVEGQKLELIAESGEWKFICFLPNRQNPRLRRVYEARAGDQLSAAQAVLERIEKGQ